MSDEKSIVPQWGDPAKVADACTIMAKVEMPRASDRALIDNLANGGRPYSREEQKKFQIQLNINFLDMTRKCQDAVGQINNAFIPAGNYFTATSKKGEMQKRQEYGQYFTTNLNKILKKGRSGKKHHFMLRSRNASVGLHGVGPLAWTNDYRLLPRFIPMEDLLIPTDTLIDLSNLTHFAINLYLTPGELYRMAMMGEVDPGWNKKAVIGALSDCRDDKTAPVFPVDSRDWYERPEYIQEMYKQNSGYLQSDAVQKIRMRAFYYQNPVAENGIQKWYRKIIMRDGTENAPPSEFIYEGKGPFADHLEQILHIQFGDNSMVAPLKYHSVRGIGMMLYGACETLNRLQCQTMQHAFQDLQTWLRVQDPTDRDRAKVVQLSQYSVMPEGVTIIPKEERHQPNPQLLEATLGILNQNISQNSSSFTQSTNDTGKEMTAFEAKARLHAANAMVSNVLGMMYAQEIFYYEEIVRRACMKAPSDPNTVIFQEMCKKDGIPLELIQDPDNWSIVAERVMGSGDNMLAQAQADAMMQQIQQFDPDSQRQVKRIWVSTLTDNPELARMLVKDTPDNSTSGTLAAEDVFATLMLGVPIPVRQGIDMVGYAGALTDMLSLKVSSLAQSGGLPTPEELQGFLTVSQQIEQTLQIVAQNDANKPAVKQINDVLGKTMNEVKAFVQRLQEQQGEQQQQPDPEAMAKANSTIMLAQVKGEIAKQNAQLKQQQSHEKFLQKQQQSMDSHAQNLQQQMDKHAQQLMQSHTQTQADIQAKGLETGANIAATTATATAKAKVADKDLSN